MSSLIDLQKLETSTTSSRKDEIIARLEEENQELKDRCNERTFAFIAIVTFGFMFLSFYTLPIVGSCCIFIILLCFIACASRRLGIEEFQELLVWAIKAFRAMKA